MAKYLIIWDLDWNLIPPDMKDRATAWKVFLDFIREDMKKGLTKEWGTFTGEMSGFTVNEGTEIEIMQGLQRYVPFVRFEAHHVSTIDRIEELTKLMSG